VTEGVLHLVFSSAGQSNLRSRLGPEDCVVLMLEDANSGEGFTWPCDVWRLDLAEPGASLSCEDMIDSRGLVDLTTRFSRILSW
jgi:hypothetical protein